MARQRGSTSGKDVGRAELSLIFGVALPTVDAWMRSGMPRNEDGSYNTAVAAAWLEDRAVANAKSKNDITDVEEAKRRKLAAGASMAELDLSKQKGEVVYIDHVAKVFEKQCHEVKSKMLAIETKAALIRATLSDADARDLLSGYIHEALSGFTGYRVGEAVESIGSETEDDSGEGISPAAEIDG